MIIERTARRLLRSLWLMLASPEEKRHALVGDPRYWKMKRAFQIQFLKKMGLQPEHYVLDLGCGTLRGGIPIIAFLEEGHYFGIDVRENVVEEGQRELEEAALVYKNPVLLVANDLSSLELVPRFDIIWAYSVLIHLNDEKLSTALRFVYRHLKEDGEFLANVNLGNRMDGEWYQGFPIVWRSLDFYEKEALAAGLQVADLGTVAELGFSSGHTVHDNNHIIRFWTASGDQS